MDCRHHNPCCVNVMSFEQKMLRSWCNNKHSCLLLKLHFPCFSWNLLFAVIHRMSLLCAPAILSKFEQWYFKLASIFFQFLRCYFPLLKVDFFFLLCWNILSLVGSFSSLCGWLIFIIFLYFSLLSDKIIFVLQLILVWAHGSLCESPWIHPWNPHCVQSLQPESQWTALHRAQLVPWVRAAPFSRKSPKLAFSGRVE